MMTPFQREQKRDQLRIDLQLEAKRQCYVCLRHWPEDQTSGVVRDVDLKGLLCHPACYRRAHSERFQPLQGNQTRRRMRSVNHWKAIVRTMRPGGEGAR
jgi:hypothetical protein